MNLRDEAIRAMRARASENQAQYQSPRERLLEDIVEDALDGLLAWLRENAALLVSDPLSLHLDSDLGEAALDGGIQFYGSIEPEAREPFLTPSHLADLLEDSDGPQ